MNPEPAKQATEGPGQVARVSPWLKWCVSILVSWHFFAVLSAVVAPPVRESPPSPLAMGIYSRVTRTYLEFLYLTNCYRFYAPDPPVFAVAWFRLEHADGSARWVELPDGKYAIHMRNQRRLGIGLMLQSGLQPSPTQPQEMVLTPMGRVFAESCVRYVAREHGQAASPVTDVQLYLTGHRVREPAEIQMGRQATDLRLYLPRYIGRYDAEGVSKATTVEDEKHIDHPTIPISLFAATVLREDVYPSLKDVPEPDRMKKVEAMDLPAPVRDVLRAFPKLLEPVADSDLQQRIREMLEARDDAGVKARLWSGRAVSAEW